MQSFKPKSPTTLLIENTLILYIKVRRCLSTNWRASDWLCNKLIVGGTEFPHITRTEIINIKKAGRYLKILAHHEGKSHESYKTYTIISSLLLEKDTSALGIERLQLISEGITIPSFLSLLRLCGDELEVSESEVKLLLRSKISIN